MMRNFLVVVAVLLVVPMMLLNPLGRPAFLGYYAGVLTLWVTLAWGTRPLVK